MKTKSGAKKRFRLSGSGKLMRNQAYKRHILTKKDTDRKKRLNGSKEVHSTNVPRIKKQLCMA